MKDNDQKEIECMERRKLKGITEKMKEQRSEQEKEEKKNPSNITRIMEEEAHE